jgi:hypothetical protein
MSATRPTERWQKLRPADSRRARCGLPATARLVARLGVMAVAVAQAAPSHATRAMLAHETAHQ